MDRVKTLGQTRPTAEDRAERSRLKAPRSEQLRASDAMDETFATIEAGVPLTVTTARQASAAVSAATTLA